MNAKTQNPKREPVKVVAIIPARGGQQSIPYKNLQELGGKTLLQWAIDIAFEAELIDAIVVSTEDARIAKEAEAGGAIVVPRPAEYSTPTSGDAGFYHHAVEWLEKERGWQPELLVNLRPTGPLRFAADVDAMVAYMQEHPEADGLKSVIPTPLHPYKMWQFKKLEDGIHPTSQKLRGAGNLEVGEAGPLQPVFDNEFRQQHGPDQPRQKIQELFPVYFQDAQIDITRRKFVLRPETLEHDNVWGANLHGYVLDPRTSADLDTADDFRHAEELYKKLSAQRKK